MLLLAATVPAYVALTLLVARADGPTALDESVVRLVLGPPHGWLTVVAVVVTYLFSPVAAWVVAVAFGAVSWWRTRSLAALAMATATLGAALTAGTATKLLVRRIRPPLDLQLVHVNGFSYPSGHTVGTLALTGIIAVLLCRGRPRPVRVLAGLLVALATVAVALTRLYLGVHWLTDVVGGALLGGSVVVVAAWTTGRYLRRQTSVAQTTPTDPCTLRNSRSDT